MSSTECDERDDRAERPDSQTISLDFILNRAHRQRRPRDSQRLTIPIDPAGEIVLQFLHRRTITLREPLPVAQCREDLRPVPMIFHLMDILHRVDVRVGQHSAIQRNQGQPSSGPFAELVNPSLKPIQFTAHVVLVDFDKPFGWV